MGPLNRGALLEEAPALHALALALTALSIGGINYLGHAWGNSAWLVALLASGPIAVEAGLAVHGMPKMGPPEGPATVGRYANAREAPFLGVGALLAVGIAALRFAPNAAAAALTGAALVAPAGYFLAYTWGPAVLVITDAEAAFLVRGRLRWRAPLGPDTWIKLDRTSGKHKLIYASFGTRVRKYGTVVDGRDLPGPQFIALIGDLRLLASRRHEIYLVDLLEHLKTAEPRVEPSVARTSFNAPSEDGPLDYELPPP